MIRLIRQESFEQDVEVGGWDRMQPHTHTLAMFHRLEGRPSNSDHGDLMQLY